VPRTAVSFHLKNIYGKLQAHSKSEAIAKALRERLICWEDLVRNVITVFLVAGAISAVPAAAVQTGGSKAAPMGACSVLSKAEVKEILRPDPKRANAEKRFDDFAPTEEPIGSTGSACFYSGLIIQVDPMSPERLEEIRKSSGSAWAMVSGVGDAAYFEVKKPVNMAGLYVRAGQRVVTVMLDYPMGADPESVRPTAIALARALLAKLR
jgi:hypothetical protein